MKPAEVDGRSLRRKHAGTGKYDTSVFTWAAMRREYIAGTEPLTDVARRHGVLYCAAHERCRIERWAELRPRPPTPEPQPPPTRKGRPAYPSPCCGFRSSFDYVSLEEDVQRLSCSRCGRAWTRRLGGPRLYVVPSSGGRKAARP
jgi:hypothetical protein